MRTGGMRSPSSQMVRALAGIEPGTMPPTSTMWPKIEEKPTSTFSWKIGIITHQSLLCEIEPLQA